MEHTHEQQQKDFLSSFFSAEHPMDHLQAPTEGQHQQAMFQFSGASAPAQSTLGIHPSHQQPAMNSQFNIELLGNFMQMQGIDPPLPPASMSSPTIAPYNPQLLLEQQFKLTQLQQLQQLQNQIFQQQVGNSFHSVLLLSVCGRSIAGAPVRASGYHEKEVTETCRSAPGRIPRRC